MKQLLMIAVMAIVSLSAKAQFAHNGSACDVEYREVCIDVSGAPGGCSITNVGPWISVPAFTMVWLTPSGCAPPDQVAFEVRYDPATTGCSASIIVKQPFTPCSAFPVNGSLGPCAPCNPNGLNIHANPINLHIDPM